ncbi:hypothetical protein [Bacillus sp. AFS040349]|uniref:hypothetical protein n=1 Tax=Bacillus sp. AFS040349 TaxID=2033502 RepID=UPI000BFE38C3|nr:hypothetical protein [Bacillus sp. AFS040349]PGT81569.1 hypothetical protein COD11_17260 [Bacillus sp. AFS040349]
MIFVKVETQYIDSNKKPQKAVYAVALPAKTLEEAKGAINEGVAFSMRKNGNKLIRMEATETDIKTYMKLAQ